MSILLPKIAYPPILPPTINLAREPASSPFTHLATLIPCPSSCASSIPHQVLATHLVPSTLRAYSIAIDSALSRALLTSPTHGLAKPHKCPFCPFTVLRPPPFPLLSRSLSHWTVLSPYLALARTFLFVLAFLTGDPSPSRWAAAGVRLREMTAEVALREGGAIFKCARMGECGRESCLGCGGEVWGGVVCCYGGGPGAVGARVGESADEDTDEVRVEKKKEECRLFVERAMTEALIRTVSTYRDLLDRLDCTLTGSSSAYSVRDVSSGSQSRRRATR